MLEFRQKNNSFSYYILYFSVTKKRSEIRWVLRKPLTTIRRSIRLQKIT